MAKGSGGIKVECTKKLFDMLSEVKKGRGSERSEKSLEKGYTYRIRTVFFPTISDGTDFSCGFLSRPKNVLPTDNGLQGWVSGFK